MKVIELSQEIISELHAIGEPMQLKSHSSLLQYGERSNAVYLVKKGGAVLMHIHPESGRERAINFFIPQFHPVASNAESFYSGEASNYHLKTFTNSDLIKIRREQLDDFIRNNPLAQDFQEYAIQTLLEKNSMRAQLISLNSLEMLQYLHQQYPQILQHVPSKYIANFLGVSPQWLSKLKHQL